MPPTDEEFAQRLDDECNTGDNEEDHMNADAILCDLLRQLGYAKTVLSFAAVRKWYA